MIYYHMQSGRRQPVGGKETPIIPGRWRGGHLSARMGCRWWGRGAVFALGKAGWGATVPPPGFDESSHVLADAGLIIAGVVALAEPQ